jgi:PKD repeat protein
VNGTASITPEMINNGSNDNCSPVTLTVSKSTFNCTNLGANTVTLTVTDVSGNSSTCQAVVTVVGELPTCSIVSVPTNTTYTDGVSTNLYLGYGAQSTQLQLSVPASGAPYSFAWSGNGTLSSTTVQSPLFAPTAAGYYTFTVLVTNKYGCTTTCKITICVKDIRVLASNGTWDGKKVYVCHVPPGNPANSNTLEISVNAVSAHIGPGGHATDRLGKCDMQPCSAPAPTARVAQKEEPKVKAVEELIVKVAPNPSTTYFQVSVQTKSKEPITIRFMDVNGKMLQSYTNQEPSTIFRVGQSWVSGTYFAEVAQGDKKKTVRLVKGN